MLELIDIFFCTADFVFISYFFVSDLKRRKKVKKPFASRIRKPSSRRLRREPITLPKR